MPRTKASDIFGSIEESSSPGMAFLDGATESKALVATGGIWPCLAWGQFSWWACGGGEEGSGPPSGLIAALRDGSHVAEPRQAAEARAPGVGQREERLCRQVLIVAEGEGENARVPLHVQLGSPQQLHLGVLELALQLLQAERRLGPAHKVLGAGPGKAHGGGGAAEMAAHLLQRRGHHEGLVHRRAAGAEEQAGCSPRRRLAASPRPCQAAALPLDVAVEVVGAGEALVAELALVGPHARVDAHVVLQVVVVHELGIAVDAEVRPLPRVLAHVDFQLVLPAKRKSERGSGGVGLGAWVPPTMGMAPRYHPSSLQPTPTSPRQLGLEQKMTLKQSFITHRKKKIKFRLQSTSRHIWEHLKKYSYVPACNQGR